VGIAGLIYSTTPGAVAGSRTYIAVSVGMTSACAIGADGHPYCWGNCPTGCGGAYTSVKEFDSPTLVPGGPTFTTISTTSGGPFDFGAINGPGTGGASCALTAAGATYCWGSDAFGPIGDGNTPTAVLTGLTVASLSLSAVLDHGCAVVSGGSSHCWGYDGDGQLGNNGMGGDVPVTAPAQVLGGLAFVQISSGWGTTCALTAAGAAYCWGQFSGFDYGAPVAVSMPPNVTFTQISVGSDHTCALAADTNVWCWGDNTYGELGNGSTARSGVPVPVTP
jgi:alpha-tubulin suppressor-like RCC1 family protein